MRVRCINAEDTYLVMGQEYEVSFEEDEHYYLVGNFRQCHRSRFEIIKEEPIILEAMKEHQPIELPKIELQFVKCIDATNSCLTKNKIYSISCQSMSRYYLFGLVGDFSKDRFETLETVEAANIEAVEMTQLDKLSKIREMEMATLRAINSCLMSLEDKVNELDGDGNDSCDAVLTLLESIRND